MKFPPLSFAVLDTETTGVLPRVHRIMEFASMRVEGGEIVDTYEQLFSVEDEVPPYVQVLTRIKVAMLEGQPFLKDNKDEILSHLGKDTLLVGQNLSFDIGMLKAEGIDLSDRPWVDTSLLASLVFPEFRSYSLAYVSNALKLNHSHKHRALGDVRATMELLCAVWERLQDLSPDQLEHAKKVMQRSSPGYQKLFDALPASKTKTAPKWMKMPVRDAAKIDAAATELSYPKVGTVDMREEGLDPQTLPDIIAAAAKDDATTHWIAVKNLESTVRRLALPKNVRVLHPPSLLLDPEAKKRLEEQLVYTAEESTIALKLAWYPARVRSDLPLHGNERDVWNGKLACSAQSPTYLDQFKKIPSVLLLDHRQLLQFLADSEHSAHGALTGNTHVIIDDASMLEDTATKAYGHYCSLDDLRAAAQGDAALTKIVDLAAIWVEKMRHQEDQHLLTPADFDRPETKGMREQLADALKRLDLPERTLEQLRELDALLDTAHLKTFLMWAERKPNGDLVLQAFPEHIDLVLAESLYNKYATTLLTPEGGGENLPEVVPQKFTRTVIENSKPDSCRVPIECRNDTSLDQFLMSPPNGRSILLAPSKRIIEMLFVRFTEALEEKGITLICQGLGGGQGRMEAEFLATPNSVWLLTPWMYEGLELPEDAVSHLVLDTVPFDHPGAPLFNRRRSHFQNPFDDYALPRVEHRLFRILRMFCRHRTKDSDVTVIDKRLFEKSYGERLKSYLKRFASAEIKIATEKKGMENQLKLF